MQKSSIIPHEFVKDLLAQSNGDWLVSLVNLALAPNRPKYVTLRPFYLGPEQPLPDVSLIKKALQGPHQGAELAVSLRMTNLQCLDPLIAKTCLALEKVFNREVFCNLYFTPGQGRDCFDFHADNGETVILQLQGEKEWHYYKKTDGTPVTHLKYGRWMPPPRESSTTILMKPGEELNFAYGEVHTARFVGNVPSIHLNFCTREVTYEHFMRVLINTAAQTESPDVLAKVELDPENLEQLTQALLQRLKHC